MRNKNKGFTLAEVLITLSIIGVVAALTIPAVMKSSEKAQYIARYKKTYSMLNQVANHLKADHGSIEASTAGMTNANWLTVWQPYVKFAEVCDITRSYGGDWYDVCWHAEGSWYGLSGGAIPQKSTGAGGVTADGVIILMRLWSSNCTSSTVLAPDGTPIFCASIIVDLNGMKGPNRLGKDIHEMSLSRRGVIPYRNVSVGSGVANTCKPGVSGEEDGRTCGHEIMMGTYDWEN